MGHEVATYRYPLFTPTMEMDKRVCFCVLNVG